MSNKTSPRHMKSKRRPVGRSQRNDLNRQTAAGTPSIALPGVGRGPVLTPTRPMLADEAAAVRRFLGTPLRFGLWRQSRVQLCFIGLMTLLAFIPLAHMISIVATTGANNISNDDIVEVGTIDQILNGTYHWQNYFHDTFIRSHCFAFPFLIRLGVIVLTHWNVYVELYIGIAVALLKLALLFDAFTYLQRRMSAWLFLPILSALCFSVSQINAFTFGDASLQIQFNQVGLALGIWSLVRFQGRWYASVLMGLGGIIATWSGGGGLPVWPAFLVGLILLRYRSIWHYAVLIAFGAIAFLPYLFYEVLAPKNAGSDRVSSLLNLSLIREAIGLPFSQNFSVLFAETVGTIGVLLCVTGLALAAVLRWVPSKVPTVPALMVLVYSTINIWLATAVRGALASWYTTHFILFWMGLVGLAYALWTSPSTVPGTGSATSLLTRLRLPRLWTVTLIGVLGYLYSQTNVTYIDKAFYLYSRSPSSASCIRNFRIAPTYCEGAVFQWGVGHPAYLSTLATPLERHHLTVFAPDEEWTLQGDYILNNVQVQRTSHVPDPEWVTDSGPTPALYSDYHHLNLLVPAPDSVTWRVALPRTLRRADFSSAVADGPNVGSSAAPARFRVYLSTGGAYRLVFRKKVASGEHSWQPFDIPLKAYAGKTITLRLKTSGRARSASTSGLFRYPVINLSLEPRSPVPPEAGTTRFLPGVTAGSAGVDVKQALQADAPLDLCLGNYSYVRLEMSAAPQISPRVALVTFLLNGQSSVGSPQQQIQIPLLADGGMHEYSFNLKLLPFPQGTRLTGINIIPAYKSDVPGLTRVTALQLVRGSTVC